MALDEGLTKAEALAEIYAAKGEDVLEAPYWPRSPLGKGEVKEQKGPGGKSLSTTPRAFKERSYPSEMEGRAAGMIYDDSFANRVADYVGSIYTAIANKRFLDNPIFGGETLRGRMDKAEQQDYHSRRRSRVSENDIMSKLRNRIRCAELGI